jgi:hypothetical protein
MMCAMEQRQQVRATAWSVQLSRPGLALVVGIAIVGLCCWWGASYPGLSVAWSLICVFLVVLAGMAWLWLTVAAMNRRQMEIGVLAAPLLAGIFALGIAGHLPVKARFAASAGSFEAVVATAGPPPASESGPFPARCPKRVGLYGIRECVTFPAGYLFYDTTGAFLDDAGIAYLPRGVPDVDISPGAFESPEFNHLQGPWYTFVASW